MKLQEEYPVLMQLRSNNHHEFRHQLSAELKRISSNKNLKQFAQFLERFKKEFINDSFFYIDEINEVIKNILLLAKPDFPTYTKQLIFLAHIGDTYTFDLLVKAVSFFEETESKANLETAIQTLKEKIYRLEDRSGEFKLYPMVEIFDQWVD